MHETAATWLTKYSISPPLPRPTEKQNIYVEWEIYIYSVTPQKTEITSFIFLLQRDKLPVHQLVALETTVTKFEKRNKPEKTVPFDWLVGFPPFQD